MKAAERLARSAAKLIFSLSDLAVGKLPGPRILIYHRVIPDPVLEMEIDPDTFSAHLDWLEANADIVDLETALRRSADDGSDRLFVLSFDDGYEDLYTNAFPMLQERELPFVLYLTTNPVKTGSALNQEREALPLSWDQINEMLASGLMTLGAHTHRHTDLRNRPAAEIEEELDLSGNLIRRRTDVTPQHFAYPWGYWDPTADTLVRERYETAALGSGPPIRPDTDPYLLNRLPVQRSDGRHFFKRRMWGGFRFEDRLRRGLKTYNGP